MRDGIGALCNPGVWGCLCNFQGQAQAQDCVAVIPVAQDMSSCLAQSSHPWQSMHGSCKRGPAELVTWGRVAKFGNTKKPAHVPSRFCQRRLSTSLCPNQNSASRPATDALPDTYSAIHASQSRRETRQPIAQATLQYHLPEWQEKKGLQHTAVATSLPLPAR